jgi:hypothetical protein
VSSSTVLRKVSDTECPSWCHAHHPYVSGHTQLTDAVLREPHLTSVAIEIEQAPRGQFPRIVVSVFTQDPLEAMSADLSFNQAQRVHAALGKALQLARNIQWTERPTQSGTSKTITPDF